MTIKEMEQLSGMSRANIRFYESEGLLSPERSANGYRDYTAEDLETLRRIKLLRALQIPLEEIRQLQKGEEALSAVLTRQLSVLDGQKTAAERSCRLCRAIRDDGVDFAALDAEKYLALPECTEENTAAALSDDRVPTVRSPWRRFFARLLDLQLCHFLWYTVLWACGVHLTQISVPLQWVGTLMDFVILLLAEPLLLHWWGTTPGKRIMGLSVTDPDGGLLTTEAARQRTLGVMRRAAFSAPWSLSQKPPIPRCGSAVFRRRCSWRLWPFPERTGISALSPPTGKSFPILSIPIPLKTIASPATVSP